MKFIDKKGNFSFLITIHVKQNSKKQELIDDGEYLTILLKSKAIQNKANKELIGLFRKRLSVSTTQIQIISGMKSSTKVIQVEFNDDRTIEDIFKALILN